MYIQQFYDEALAHASYAIESEGNMALVDPGRNPQPYLDFAKKKGAEIVAIFETHPHADFISSHAEFLRQYEVPVYINPKVGPFYNFRPLEDGEEVKLGKLKLRALYTPGHSPDHNSYLVLNADGKPEAVFTGDSLFVGDVGRPDLREGVGNLQMSRKELAKHMFHTIQDTFAKLPDGVKVYPCHGAGSLCGKNMSDERSSTIGQQKDENWAFRTKDENSFVQEYLEGQPFIPPYFGHAVELNRKGAPALADSLKKIEFFTNGKQAEEGAMLVDIRSEDAFKQGHLPGAVNIQAGEKDKFETWLGTLIKPGEAFYLTGDDESQLEESLKRVAKIGYEEQLKGVLLKPAHAEKQSAELKLGDFKQQPENYTIVDVRNTSEVEKGKIFKSAISIPLPELRERAEEIPTDKPIVVHCAGGYRSAAASSLLEKKLNAKVYDLSDAVKQFQ